MAGAGVWGIISGPGPTMRGPTPGTSGAGWPVGTALSPNKLPKGDPLAAPGIWPEAEPKGEAAPGGDIAGVVDIVGAENGDAAGGMLAVCSGEAEKGEAAWVGGGSTDSGLTAKGEAAPGAVPKGLPPMAGLIAKGWPGERGVPASDPAAANGLTGKAGAPGSETWGGASTEPTSARGGGGPWRRGGSSMPLGVEVPASKAGGSIIIPPAPGGG